MPGKYSKATVIEVFRAVHAGIPPEIAGPARGMHPETARKIGEGQSHIDLIGCERCDSGGYWVYERESPGTRYWVRGKGAFVGGVTDPPSERDGSVMPKRPAT